MQLEPNLDENGHTGLLRLGSMPLPSRCKPDFLERNHALPIPFCSHQKGIRSRLSGTALQQTSTQASATVVNQKTPTLSKKSKYFTHLSSLSRWDNLMEEFNVTCLSDGSWDVPKEWPQCLPCELPLKEPLSYVGFPSCKLHGASREAWCRDLGVERRVDLRD